MAHASSPSSDDTGPTASPARHSTIARVRRTARVVCIVLGVFVVVQIAVIVLSWGLADDADAVLDGRLAGEVFADRHAAVGYLMILWGVVLVTLWVLSIRWMHRLARNVERLGRQGRWGTRWAIVGWFCPPILFVIPFLHMRELWRASDPRPTTAWRRSGISHIVDVWWVLFGLLPAMLMPLGVLAFHSIGERDGQVLAQELREDIVLQTVASTLSALAAIAFFVLVSRLTRRHMALTGEHPIQS